IEESSLRECSIGAIVNIYNNGTAYEVEFVAPDGTTTALLTLRSGDIRPYSPVSNILHLHGFLTIYSSNATTISPVSEESNILNNLNITGIGKFTTKLEKDKTTENVKKYSYLTV